MDPMTEDDEKNTASERAPLAVGAMAHGPVAGLWPLPGIIPLIPPPGPERDRFGLPTNWSALSDIAAPGRKDAVAELVRDVFDTAVRHLGEQAARELFQQTCQPTAGQKGRPKKLELSESDRGWLAIYDARAHGLTRSQREALPRRLATERFRVGRTDIDGAIEKFEKQIRRALRARDAAHARAEAARARVEAAQAKLEASAAEMRRIFGKTILA